MLKKINIDISLTESQYKKFEKIRSKPEFKDLQQSDLDEFIKVSLEVQMNRFINNFLQAMDK